ncbi:MAG: hypothetical protein Q9168_000852 [Polycauliona sp. 1 TL-2023]
MGLWSSKIHDIVKPNQHILAEPPSSPFAPHLRPLTEPSSSRYSLANLDHIEAWESDRYVTEGLLPALGPQNSTEPNRSILILANTAFATLRTRSTSIPRSQVILLAWANDIANHLAFHAAGPVRMLMWCPEKDATCILPRTIRHRTKLSLLLEMTCNIEEIVGSDELLSARQKKRDQVTELESGKRVAKLMEQSAVPTPPERETSLQKEIREAVGQSKIKGNEATGEAAPTQSRGWHEELETLKKKFKDAPKDSKGQYLILRRPKEKLDPSFIRFMELDRNFRSSQKKQGLIENLLQEQAEVDALDLQAHAPGLKEPQRTAAMTKLQQKKRQLQEHLDNTQRGNQEQFEFKKHDRKAYSSDPPLLMWDRRSAEPMKSYKEEFYPQKNLCLLDIQPRSPLPYPLTGSQFMFLRMLSTALWHNAGDNLAVLDRIAPGAFEAVTSQVPALADPTRGGERDILDLPISRLTPEMTQGLIKAWFDWPFKPNIGDLILKGSLVDDELPEDGAIPKNR